MEPAPLEEVALRSRLVAQVMLVGNDQRRLGALVVPNQEELDARQRDGQPVGAHELKTLIRNDVNKW